MALPATLAGDLVKDMAAKGLAGASSKPAGDEPAGLGADDSAPAPDDGLDEIKADIDRAAPGLSGLIVELCERLMGGGE